MINKFHTTWFHTFDVGDVKTVDAGVDVNDDDEDDDGGDDDDDVDDDNDDDEKDDGGRRGGVVWGQKNGFVDETSGAFVAFVFLGIF